MNSAALPCTHLACHPRDPGDPCNPQPYTARVPPTRSWRPLQSPAVHSSRATHTTPELRKPVCTQQAHALAISKYLLTLPQYSSRYSCDSSQMNGGESVARQKRFLVRSTQSASASVKRTQALAFGAQNRRLQE